MIYLTQHANGRCYADRVPGIPERIENDHVSAFGADVFEFGDGEGVGHHVITSDVWLWGLSSVIRGLISASWVIAVAITVIVIVKPPPTGTVTIFDDAPLAFVFLDQKSSVVVDLAIFDRGAARYFAHCPHQKLNRARSPARYIPRWRGVMSMLNSRRRSRAI